MSRTTLIAANWKMHSSPQGFDAEASPYRSQQGVDIIVLPTLLDIDRCLKAGLATGAQCGRPEESGAFTGDVSMTQIQKAGCSYVLCGHSERREHHHETDAFVAHQVVSAIECGLIPILCIGETADEREMGQSKEVVKRQLETVINNSQFSILNSQFVIAYEPVWAISGGDPTKTAASASDAEEMHAYIRSLLPKDMQESTRILYGGSMKPDNARGLLSQPNIDGGLVGGASLDPSAFRKIVESTS